MRQAKDIFRAGGGEATRPCGDQFRSPTRRDGREICGTGGLWGETSTPPTQQYLPSSHPFLPPTQRELFCEYFITIYFSFCHPVSSRRNTAVSYLATLVR